MQIAFEKVGDVAVAAVPVEELDASNAGEFKRDIAPVLEANAKLVLDLRACASSTAPAWARSFPASGS